MIYDCFTFFNELHLLDIRLNVLNDVVDKFVLVEATQTHSGADKELYYQNNKHLFEKFNGKIIHIIVDDFPQTDNAWVRENFQRNAIERGLVGCDDSDTIIISDLDEIPNPKKIIEYKNKPGIKSFRQYMFVHYLNNVLENDWCHGKMLSYKLFKSALNNLDNYSRQMPEEVNKGTTATKIRMIHYRYSYSMRLLHPKAFVYFIGNGGWHFTSVLQPKDILLKLKSYSHCDEHSPDINLEYVFKDIKNSASRSLVVSKDNLPEYIVDNQELLKDYILPNGKYDIKDLYPITSDFNVNFRRKLSWWIPDKKRRERFRNTF